MPLELRRAAPTARGGQNGREHDEATSTASSRRRRGRVEQALLLAVELELELVEHLARARLGEQLLDELELTLVEQLLLLAIVLKLDLEHTEKVLQAVELGVCTQSARPARGSPTLRAAALVPQT